MRVRGGRRRVPHDEPGIRALSVFQYGCEWMVDTHQTFPECIPAQNQSDGGIGLEVTFFDFCHLISNCSMYKQAHATGKLWHLKLFPDRLLHLCGQGCMIDGGCGDGKRDFSGSA